MSDIRSEKTSRLVAFACSTLLVLVPLIYWTSLRDYVLPPKLIVLQAVVALTFAACLIIRPESIPVPSFGLPACAYLILNSVSVLYAADPVVGLHELNKMLSGFLLFLLVANWLRPRDVPPILVAGAACGILVSLVGISEYLGWRPFIIPSAGLPSATFGYRNLAAMYLIQSIPLCIGLFAIARSRGIAVLAASSGALMLVFLIYTRTRGAWAGLIGSLLITLVIWTATRSRRPISHARLSVAKKISAVGAILLVAAIGWLPSNLPKIGPQSIDEKKASIATAFTSVAEQGAGRGRLILWKHTLEMVQDHAALGVGLGNWAVHYPLYDRGDPITFSAAPERPHNDALWILSEVGLLGFICYIWLAILVLKAVWRHLASSNQQTRWMAAACFASLLAISGHSLFSFPRERIPPTMLFWLSLGLLAALERPARRVWRASATRVMLILALLLALLQFRFTMRVCDFEAHTQAARNAQLENDMPKMSHEAAAALDAGAFHPEAIHLKGYALNQMGEFPKSRDLYRSALHKRPYDIQLLNGMAIASQNIGHHEEALGLYGRALELIPNLIDIRYNQGGLYTKMGRLTEAINVYQKIIEQRPEEAQAHFALGDLSNRLGRLLDAVESYRAFLKYWKGDARYVEMAQTRISRIESLKMR